jgi:surfactin synthase thioesterase subunit
VTEAAASAVKTTLYCIPHAGGSAAFYARLIGLLPQSVDCRPLELPGRGRRSREPLATGMDDLARDLLHHMDPHSAPWAIFGHSMGALLALLCAQKARKRGLPAPVALIVSGAASPSQWATRRPRPMSTLSSRELWQRVAGIGGLPDCVAASGELLRYLEPILRADFAALEAWTPVAAEPLSTPITAFFGQDDVVSEEEGRLWSRMTAGAFRLRMFPGGHFYLQERWEDLAAHIAGALAPAPPHG